MLVLRMSRLLLLLILLLPRNNQAMDGCERGFWRCGDVCIDDSNPCNCGGSRFRVDDRKWCCATNCTGGCYQWKEVKYRKGLICVDERPSNCSTGVPLKLTEGCGQSQRCNYYPDDDHRNSLSHYSAVADPNFYSRSHVAACANTSTCVKEGEGEGTNHKPTICTGDSSCAGELDWCRKEERKEEKCLKGFIRCPRTGGNAEGGNGTKSIPGQCIEPRKFRDGKENDCLDRSDEDPFQEAATARNKETIIEFGSLRNCTDEYRRPGLECGRQGSSNSSKCLWVGHWCKEKFNSKNVDWALCPVLGEGIRVDNPTLCSNISFWRKISCGDEERMRCQGGNSGQCVTKEDWGVEGGNKNCITCYKESCVDGSDLSRPIKAHGGQHSQSVQLWKTESLRREDHIWIRGTEEGAKYVKEARTGRLMIAVSEESCKASQGFVCKVRHFNFEMNHDNDVSNTI